MRRTLGGELGTKGLVAAAGASPREAVKMDVIVLEIGMEASGAAGSAESGSALVIVAQQSMGAARRPGSVQQPWVASAAAVGIGQGHTQSAARDTA